MLTGPDHHRAFRFGDADGLIPLTEYPGPARSAGYGINEQGDVVGNSGTESTPDATAWLWTQQGGRVNLIQLVDRPDFHGIRRGQDINDNGQIVATAITDEPYGSAVVLTPAARPPAPAGTDGRPQTSPHGVGLPKTLIGVGHKRSHIGYDRSRYGKER